MASHPKESLFKHYRESYGSSSQVEGHFVEQTYVYILCCAGSSFYVGMAKDLESRVRAHNNGHGPAYTLRRRPVGLVYFEIVDSVRTETQREQQLKRWSHAKKQALVLGDLLQLKARSTAVGK
ncbi:hypothetical protein YTPLAS18_11620 [Nitrospira sp.]|nr:hypothetical protein YTPLAS18_11620 [Nitrospira sp.]